MTLETRNSNQATRHSQTEGCGCLGTRLGLPQSRAITSYCLVVTSKEATDGKLHMHWKPCHCLSSTIYSSLPGACPRWKERASSRTICWKERASSRSRKHVFHSDEFFCSRVTGQSTSGSVRMRLPFPSQTYAHTHTHTHTHTDTTNCKNR